jgi:hypothetical protein
MNMLCADIHSFGILDCGLQGLEHFRNGVCSREQPWKASLFALLETIEAVLGKELRLS